MRKFLLLFLTLTLLGSVVLPASNLAPPKNKKKKGYRKEEIQIQ